MSRGGTALAASILLVALVLATGGCATTGPGDEGPIFYPLPPQRPRIQFLTSFASAADVEGEASLLMKFLVGDVRSARRLRKPTGLAAHGGVIYVADPGWDTVLVLDLEQRLFTAIGDRGEGKLRVPVAVAIDTEGHVFVADTGRNQVLEFNARKEFIWAYGDPSVMRPTGVAVDEDFLYVVDRGQHRVEVIDRRTKKTVRRFGKYGEREGYFNIPTSICRDDKGRLYVTDMANFRVQQFDAKGQFIRSFGFLGDGPGTFARPRGLAIDRDGHLYTADGAFENVQIWDSRSAQVLLAFGGAGTGPGDMYLPAGVHVSYELAEHFREYVDPNFDLEYVILVANNYGPHKVAVYGFVNPKDPSRYPDLSSRGEGPNG